MEPRTTRLNPLDTAWLFTESRATPNHVGGLLTFRLPPGAPQDYLRQMMVEKAGGRFTVPQIFIGETHVGGCDELYALDRAGKLDPLLNP